MGVDINRRVIGGENGTEWTVENNIQHAIRNSGNNHNSGYIVSAWQRYAKDEQDLLWRFRFQFNSTFGTAGAPVLIKLPVWFGVQLTVDSSIVAFGMPPAGVSRDWPWFDVGGFYTGGGIQTNWGVSYGGGVLGTNSDFQFIRYVNNGGGSLLDTACSLNTSIHGIDVRIPILEWR